MRRLASILAVTLIGCGDSTPSLDAGFGKTWSGDLTIACTGESPLVYTGGRLTLTVSGDTLTSPVRCLDGTLLSVTATGSGKTATWSGSLSCPPVLAGSCASVVLTRTSSTFTLNSNGTLTVAGIASKSGCGTTVPCTISFPGT